MEDYHDPLGDANVRGDGGSRVARVGNLRVHATTNVSIQHTDSDDTMMDKHI